MQTDLGSRSALRITPFRWLIGARATIMVGNAIAPFALAFALLDLGYSATELAVVIGARSLAQVGFLLFGGVLSDRYPKRTVMVTGSVLSGISQAAVAVLLLTETNSLASLAGLSAFNGIVTATTLPASSALLPQVVPAGQRQSANALIRMTTNGASLLAGGVAGFLVVTVGSAECVAIDAVTFLLGAVLFARLPKPTAERSTADRSTERLSVRLIVNDLRSGWSEFWSLTWVWVVVVAAMLINAAFSGSMQVLGPIVADDTVGRELWSLALALQTAGLMAGALFMTRLDIQRPLRIGVVTVGALSLLPLTLALRPSFVCLALAAILAGLGLEIFGIAWETSLQNNVAEDKLARVYSYDMLGSLAAVPLGQFLVGPLSEGIGTKTTLILAAGLIAATVPAMLASRAVRSVTT